jgi:hypothetical protein
MDPMHSNFRFAVSNAVSRILMGKSKDKIGGLFSRLASGEKVEQLLSYTPNCGCSDHVTNKFNKP